MPSFKMSKKGRLFRLQSFPNGFLLIFKKVNKMRVKLGRIRKKFS